MEKQGLMTIPSGWIWISIGETGEYINGYAFKPSHRDNNGLPIIRIQNLTDESKPLNRTSLVVPPEYKVEAGDLLLSWSATLDVFNWRRGPALVNQHIFKVIPDERILKKNLLFYWLKIAIQQLQKTQHLHGSTMMHVNRGPFMAHKIPMPPIAEQIRIVEKLEELFSDLDSGVAELKAAQKKLALYRQSLLKAAVEGALTADWRKHNQLSETGAQLLERILAERRARWEAKQLAKFKEQGKNPPQDWQKKYPEPIQPNTTDLPELPEGWAWATIDQLSFVVRGASPRPAGDPRYFGGVIPWITVGSLTADEDMYLVEVDQFVTEAGKEASRFIEPNTLLLTNSGATLGVPKITKIGGCINDGSVAFLDIEEARKIYLYWYLSTQTKKLRALNQGAAQPNLNTDIVRKISVPICSSDELEEINRVLEAAAHSIKEQAKAVNHSLKQSAAQRQNILRAAFSGQLVPQDPNDEPASVLLERIRAERAVQEAKKAERSRKVKGS